MGNVFQTEAVLHRKFDLKGSTHGRTAGARASDPHAVLKARSGPTCCSVLGNMGYLRIPRAWSYPAL